MHLFEYLTNHFYLSNKITAGNYWAWLKAQNNCEYFVVNKSYDGNYRVVLVYLILGGNIVMALPQTNQASKFSLLWHL